MRRADLLQACERVLNDLKESGVREVLRMSVTRTEMAKVPAAAMNSFGDLSIRMSAWGETEKQVAKILDLMLLQNADFWTTLTVTEKLKESTQLHFRVHKATGFALDQLPKLLVLLQPSRVPESDRVIRILLVEEPGVASSPLRIIRAIESVVDLYEVCAVVTNSAQHDLAIVACDSGSDKSFDFIGAAKVVECLKELIITIWDRVIFYRERKLAARLDLVSHSLPMLEHINELKKTGALDPSQAELLRRKIIAGTTKWLETGIVTPEIEMHTTHNPRQLMAPEPRLLTMGEKAPRHGSTGTKAKDDAKGREADAEGTEADAEGTEADAERTEVDAEGTEADAEGTEADAEGTEADAGGAAAATSRARGAADLSELTSEERATLNRLLGKINRGGGEEPKQREVERKKSTSPKRRGGG